MNETLITGGGTGSNSPPYVVSPFQAIQDRVIGEGGTIRWDLEAIKLTVFVNTEACLMLVHAYASEFYGRTTLPVSSAISWCVMWLPNARTLSWSSTRLALE